MCIIFPEGRSTMNITFQEMNTSYRTPIPAQQKRVSLARKARGDYDTVNIRRPQATINDDESFARMLARKTASQLGETSQDKVNEISRKIADGTYQTDAQRIAGRMLGLS